MLLHPHGRKLMRKVERNVLLFSWKAENLIDILLKDFIDFASEL